MLLSMKMISSDNKYSSRLEETFSKQRSGWGCHDGGITKCVIMKNEKEHFRKLQQLQQNGK